MIGSGPAGHTACIYLARANLQPLMLEGDSSDGVAPGGLLTTTKEVENFPGFPDGVLGYDLTDNFRKQSEKFGTKIISEMVIQIKKQEKCFSVETKENVYQTKAILIATGSNPKHLAVPGYTEFWQKGISSCAVCDGSLPVFRKVPIAVVGGGDTACEEALHLAHTASKVYLIHRRDKLRASSVMTNRVLQHPKIEMIWDTEVVEISGDTSVKILLLENVLTKEIQSLEVRGLFVAIGHTPNTKFVKDLIDLDNEGRIITDETYRTNVEGIWAAGDCQDRNNWRQAITSAGSGCAASLEIGRWLESQN